MKHSIWLVKIMMQYANIKFIESSLEYNSNGELSDPQCNSKNKGLTLVRLPSHVDYHLQHIDTENNGTTLFIQILP